MAKELNMRNTAIDQRMRTLFAKWMKDNPVMPQGAFDIFKYYQHQGRRLSAFLSDGQLKSKLDHIVQLLGQCEALLKEVVEVPVSQMPYEAPAACGGTKSLCAFQLQCVALKIKVRALSGQLGTVIMTDGGDDIVTADWIDDFDWLSDVFQNQIREMTLAEVSRQSQEKQIVNPAFA